MGSVADDIAKKIISSSSSKVVDPEVRREVRKLAIEAGLVDDPLTGGKFAGYDPCHVLYGRGQNFVSLLAEGIATMREAKGYTEIVRVAEKEYLPLGPPTSPLTVSYFTMWAMFDVRFGRSRETMGTCILPIARMFDCPSWLVDSVELMQESRMGFYVHCGSDGKSVLLREVGTRQIVSCIVPAGYVGRKGEIWFVRLLPPPNRLCHDHIVFITPYVLRDHLERQFIDYLERELVRMKAKKQLPRNDYPRRHLMKYGPRPNHWNDYVVRAYSGHQYDAIFLTGIPDIRQSLPHA